jgi:hypothetical protein
MLWKKKYDHLDVSERANSAGEKRIADLSPSKHMLSEAL